MIHGLAIKIITQVFFNGYSIIGYLSDSQITVQNQKFKIITIFDH